MHRQTRAISARNRACRGIMLLASAFLLMDYSVKALKVCMVIEKNHHRQRTIKDYVMHRKHITIDSVTDVLTDREFALAYRMQRTTFRKLLLVSKDRLRRDKRMGLVAKRPAVSPAIRLAICLRMMAGASAYDLATSYKVSKPAVYAIFLDTRRALNATLKLPGIPDTFHGLKKMAIDFQLSRTPPNPFPGCIGSLDGIAIHIKKPARSKHPASYYCRKGYYAITVQAVCDSNYRFRCFSAACRGSTHDSLAHLLSALGRYLEGEGLDVYFWIAGDEAYICGISLITPVPATQANDVEDAFNFYHSSSRMHIEQAFGMLVRKWMILKRMEYSVSNSGEIISLALKLHNFCIDYNGTLMFPSHSTEEQKKAIDESEEWCVEGKQNYAELLECSRACKRDHLICIIKNGDYRRPPMRMIRVPEYLRSGRNRSSNNTT